MAFESILRDHLSRYPSMQIQDVYKLLHQAAFGSEHAISSVEGVRTWMERELADMGTGPSEPMIDPISVDGQIVRVHLRPFVEQGGNVDMLLSAFILTANEFPGNKQVMEIYWKTAVAIRHFPVKGMDDFIQAMREQDFPAVHHSPEYERLYRPAYRVVWRKFIS